MNFEFNIPLHRSDLLTKTSIDQYVVDEVFLVRMLPIKLQEYKNALRTKGSLSVLECFDSVFSVLETIHQVRPEIKEEAWELAVKAVTSHPNVLVEFLEGDLDKADCQNHRNALKMNCYLLCQLMDILEDEICRADIASVGVKGRKKTTKASGDIWTLDWDYEKERAIKALSQVLQLKIHRLWDPPVVEEEFTSLVTNACYKLLENPGITRKQPTRDVIIHILGTMVRKHNHNIAFSLKTVQLLQNYEHLAPTMALAMQILANEFGAKSVVADTMREIGRIDSKDLTKDTSGTRAYASFMVELSEKVPELMLSNISVIMGLLEGESYNMRNSVLTVLGSVVIKVLSREDLNENQRANRDQFLDELYMHLHDVHAFVRSKCLQIWTNIVNEKAVPLNRQHTLLERVIGRLRDKSSQVRKYAIQLLSALLRTNPFAAKFTHEEMRAHYEAESAKLKEMMPEEIKQEPVETMEVEENDPKLMEWQKIEKDIYEAVATVLNKNEEDEENDNLISDSDTIISIKERVQSMLQSAENKEAVELYLMAKDAFPAEKPFSSHSGNSEREETESELDADESKEAKLVFDGLKFIFLGEPDVVEVHLPESASRTGQVPEGLVNEVSTQQIRVQFLKDCVEFANLVEQAIPVMCQLLESKNNTDVMEAIDFFVTSHEFGLLSAMMGIRRMLGLIWSKEQGIKERVVEAYQRLYLKAEKTNARAWAAEVAKNLISLTIGATVGNLTSLEELVSQFVKTKELTRKVIQVFWERFSLKIPGTTAVESHGALVLLGMAARADEDIVKSNIDVLVKEGLGPRAEQDFLLARDTCGVLLKIAHMNKPRENKQDAPVRFPKDHDMFERMSNLVVKGISNLESNHWVPMAEEAINAIYLLSEHPDSICQDIIRKLVTIVQTTAAQGIEDGEEKEDTQDSGVDGAFTVMLTRFLTMVGHVALRQLVHLDVSIFSELRRRHCVQEAKNEANKAQSAASVVSASSMKKNKNKAKESEEVTMEEEMGLTGAAAEDAEVEYIRKITEEHLVNGNVNMLSLVQPIISMVCNNPGTFRDPKLQSAASLALAKFMTVSSQFCDNHLQLLFTILEKSPHPVIRGNLIIALGNITFRFPNLIEPWTAHLYARLRDESTQVRKNTLMMLTHLILNDMIKVKGQISELASCIVDFDTNISNLAKLFFFELSKKGNAIYNIMPDIISRMSDPEIGVEEENFRTIMKYLFGFIQKDRQCESLVEKLCHRFRATRVERQWRDLAYCLSMLSYSDKSLRKLQDNKTCFLDKLSDDDVFSSFSTIISGARKFAKPEIKTLLDELEQQIDIAHNKGIEDEEAFAKAQQAATAVRGKKTPGRKKTATRGQVKAKAAASAKKAKSKSWGDSDEEDEEEQEFTKIRPSRKKGSHKPKLSFSSDEDDMELFQEDQEMKTGSHQPAQTGEDGRESDAENADPNITYSSPNLVKKRHKSVCSGKNVANGTPKTARRGTRKGRS